MSGLSPALLLTQISEFPDRSAGELRTQPVEKGPRAEVKGVTRGWLRSWNLIRFKHFVHVLRSDTKQLRNFAHRKRLHAFGPPVKFLQPAQDAPSFTRKTDASACLHPLLCFGINLPSLGAGARAPRRSREYESSSSVFFSCCQVVPIQ
jgi:hypothetical protein